MLGWLCKAAARYVWIGVGIEHVLCILLPENMLDHVLKSIKILQSSDEVHCKWDKGGGGLLSRHIT